MSGLRKITVPFSWGYRLVTSIRNCLFDQGIFKTTTFDIPVITIGNLSVGGTGKTPQVEYLVRLLQGDYRIAILSRGYKRKTEGFVLADKHASAQTIGDEPYQYYSKFKEITVAVDADRVHGINQLLRLENPPNLILLDDAYQHRKVTGKFNILLTRYADLYTDDWMLPAGNLRETKKGAERAKVIVVTKCPKDLSESKREQVLAKIQPLPNQQVHFSYIDYAAEVTNGSDSILLDDLKSKQVVLVTGIAKPEPLVTFLKEKGVQITHLNFPDHYDFKSKDIQKVEAAFESISGEGKMILSTEKDFVRLKGKLDCYYLEIQNNFIGGNQAFDENIKTCLKE